jgi:outer membrane biosynthesis protein TonB
MSHGSEVIAVRFPSRVIIFSLAFVAVLCFSASWQAQTTPAEIQRKVKDAFRPEYSQLPKRLRLSGSVRVEVTIAPDGKVTKAHLVGGHPVLAESAKRQPC